jgi:hypothetical protein
MNANVTNETLKYAAQTAHAKLVKYYGRINNPAYSIAIVLTPRFKLGVYDKTQDSAALKAAALRAVNAEYEKKRLLMVNAGAIVHAEPEVCASNLSKWDPDESSNMSELETYLSEPRLKVSSDLKYWQENQLRFPVLAKMARNHLAIQGTNRDVEGLFSKVTKV